jgi:hypothetical protein
MTTVERTRQQLDPAGSAGVVRVTILLTAGGFAYAVVRTVYGANEISNPPFAVLALVLLAVAEVVVIWRSTSAHALLTARTHAVAIILALAAILCEALGQWGTNVYIRDDWGPIALGVILVALGPYRPAWQIAASGVLSALGIGILTLLEVPSLATPGPPFAFVILTVTPTLGLCFAATMFSKGVVASIERWQARAQLASVNLLREFREGITRSVQQDRVTILSRDVLPFFADVLARDEITVHDRARAREIADAIRQVMVEEVDRSWLETLIELAGAELTHQWGAAAEVVDDPCRLATAMNTPQRTAMRALLVVFRDIPEFTRADLRISLVARAGRSRGALTAQLPLTDFAMRSTFAPFFAVMRAVFTEVEVDFTPHELTLRFSYDSN